MNENWCEPKNVVQLDLHGTRPDIYAATSAHCKLVFALPPNHKLSLPIGK